MGEWVGDKDAPCGVVCMEVGCFRWGCAFGDGGVLCACGVGGVLHHSPTQEPFPFKPSWLTLRGRVVVWLKEWVKVEGMCEWVVIRVVGCRQPQCTHLVAVQLL
jgi:hypothetical protein